MPVFFKRTFGLQKYRTPEQSGCVFKRGPHTTEANRARLGTATAPPEQQNGARRRLGLPKAAGAPHAHLREGRQRAARAPSHFGAGKRTYSHTHSPPPFPRRAAGPLRLRSGTRQLSLQRRAPQRGAPRCGFFFFFGELSRRVPHTTPSPRRGNTA